MKKSTSVIFVLLLSMIFFFTCVDGPDKKHDPRGEEFIGSAACAQCHQSIYNNYTATTHFTSTAPANRQTIFGNFNKGQNSYTYNDSTTLLMEQRDSGFFQALYQNNSAITAHRFDISFGKKHAQTFLFWKGDQTFELPVSYSLNTKTWVGSPGFSNDAVNFNRFIGTNCFECHSSNIDSKVTMSANGVDETFDKNSLIFGIDCERCHGPAANHVNYHLANPAVKEAKYISMYKSLNNQQRIDMCAICHSGNDKEKERSIFKFRPGQNFADYFSPYTIAHKRFKEFDVHGSQYQLLAASKCSLKSNTLTCTTCHDPHTNAEANLETYSAKCISCHQTAVHETLPATVENANLLKTNCIDCHMPRQASQAISFRLQRDTVKASYLLRTHKIAVYK